MFSVIKVLFSLLRMSKYLLSWISTGSSLERLALQPGVKVSYLRVVNGSQQNGRCSFIDVLPSAD